MADPTEPEDHGIERLQEALEDIQRRILRLPKMTAFDGQLAKREMMDTIYPVLALLCEASVEHDEALGQVLDDVDDLRAGVARLPLALALDLKRAVELGFAVSASADAIGLPEGDPRRAQFADAHRWFAEHAEPLIAAISALSPGCEDAEGEASDEEGEADASEEKDEEEEDKGG